jgi:hypothetical protein
MKIAMILRASGVVLNNGSLTGATEPMELLAGRKLPRH